MKYVFTSIKMVLIAAIAYFCVDIMYKKMLAESFILPEQNFSGIISKNISQQPWEISSQKNQFAIIGKRNLFKVEVEGEKEELTKNQTIEEKDSEKIERTNLSLALWGTVTGQGEAYAVIEDKKLRQQALYEVGDVIQGAELKEILRHQVIFGYLGKDQVLEMESDNKNVTAERISTDEINGNPMPANESAVIRMPGEEVFFRDNNALMKQVKMRPHFTEGEPDGLMVYGIRPNSFFKQLGLKNGDILKDINGIAIVSPEDTSSLYSEINEAEEARITLLRRGKIEELNYHVKTGQYLITGSPGENGKNKGDE